MGRGIVLSTFTRNQTKRGSPQLEDTPLFCPKKHGTLECRSLQEEVPLANEGVCFGEFRLGWFGRDAERKAIILAVALFGNTPMRSCNAPTHRIQKHR